MTQRAAVRRDPTGRTALVTGSTQGIERAVAAGPAAAGAPVGVNGRTREAVAEAVASLPAGDYVPVPADLP